MSPRLIVKFSIGMILAALLVGWLLRGTDRQALLDQLAQASIPGLILAASLNLGHNLFRAWRWRALLDPVRVGLPLRSLLAAILIGYLTTWTVPGRLGEVVRPVLLTAQERVPLGPCLGSILADRLLDGLAVVVLFGLGTLVTTFDGDAATHAAWIRSAAMLLVAVILIPLVVLIAARSARERLTRRLAGRRGVLPWVVRSILAVADGTAALREPRLFWRISWHTAAAWSLIAVGTWVGIRSCGVAVPLPGVCVLLPLLVLGIAVPTPGGAGGYHAAMTFGLVALLGVDRSLAVGASLIVHAVVIVPVVIVGAAVLATSGVRWHELMGAAAQVRRLGQASHERPEAVP
jgi:hypothetical protein